MAKINEQHKEIDEAFQLLEQSLASAETTGDFSAQAAALHQMAILYSQQGQGHKALQHFQKALVLRESVGDVRGQSATLAYMAYLAVQAGEADRAVTLYQQAAQCLGQVRDYGELVKVLVNLGVTAKENVSAYLAQALWLCLRIQVTLEDAMRAIALLYQQQPEGDDLAMLLGAMAFFLCASQDEEQPALGPFREAAMRMLSAVANARGVKSEADFSTWLTEQQLNEPQVVMTRLVQALEATIGDTWCFDPQSFGM